MENNKKSLKSEILEWVVILITAFIVAFFINNVIITNSFIPTPSMESNLPVGSRLFGFRLNYLFSKPKRGDVVIFDYGYECKNKECKVGDSPYMYQKNEEGKCPRCKTESKGAKKVHFIKRVVGLPGEHIEIKSDYAAEQELFKTTRFQDSSIKATCGHVYINGEKYEEDYLNEPMIVNSFFTGVDVTIPEDCYFLLGDNRNNSEDARFWPNKFINIKDIEAKAYVIYWPLNRMGIIR